MILLMASVISAACLAKSESGEKVEYYIMTQSADVNIELPSWPIAPDGYIPNSVIRNWKKKGKQQSDLGSWQDLSFNAPCHLDEGSMSNQEDENPGNIWFVEGDDGEEEITFEVKRKRSQTFAETSKNEDDTQNANKKGGKTIKVKEGIGAFKPRMHQRREEGEDELGGFAFQQLPDVQVERSVTKNLNVSAERERELSSTLNNTDRFM